MTKEETKIYNQFKKDITNLCKVKPTFKKTGSNMLHLGAYYAPEVHLLKNYVDKTASELLDYIALNVEDNDEFKQKLIKLSKDIRTKWYHNLIDFKV